MNTTTLKLELLFTDRKQIVEDIAGIVSANDLNIIAMEVENKQHFNDLQVHSLKEMVGSYEKGILKSVLKRYPSIRQGARALKMSHTAIINKIKKYGLESE